MYPPGIVTDVTFYILYRDPDNLDFIIERAVLENVAWQEMSVSVAKATGQNAVDRVNIHVPMYREQTGRDYVPPHEWYELLPSQIHDYWTVDVGAPLQVPGQPAVSPVIHTRFVRGIVTHEFNWGDANSIRLQMVEFDRKYTDAVRISAQPGAQNRAVNVRDDVWPPSLREVLIGAS